jgi:cytochrome P450
VGHSLAFLHDKPAFLRACHESYGDVVSLNIGGPTWLLNDPTDVKHVLVDNAASYEKTNKLTSARGRMLSGEGLHTATGLDHVYLRRMVQPLFHRRIVAHHAALIHDVTDATLRRWPTGGTVHLLPALMELSQQVMLRALFGPSFDDAGGRFARAVTARRAFIEFFFTSNLPWPEYWPLPVVQRYRAARAEMLAVIDAQIAVRRRDGADGDDWLSMLVGSASRDGVPLSDAHVRDEAVTLTGTGYETVAANVAWTLHLLATHPQVEQAVRDELATVDAAVSPLLAQVTNESLRLYPPTWLYVRMPTADDTLPSGTRVRRGEKIYLSPYTMHRHPAWYAAPDRFDPAHFAESAVRERPRFAFYPFGGGARQCIGEPFARLEIAIVLAAMLTRFRIEPLERGAVALRPSIVLEPRDGLPVRLRLMG